jgi:hypothetical protein
MKKPKSLSVDDSRLLESIIERKLIETIREIADEDENWKYWDLRSLRDDYCELLEDLYSGVIPAEWQERCLVMIKEYKKEVKNNRF